MLVGKSNDVGHARHYKSSLGINLEHCVLCDQSGIYGSPSPRVQSIPVP